MSTEGGAAVVILPLALVGVAAAAVIGVAAGTGILVYQGAVFCGEKLKENYENACKTWTESQARAIAEARQNVQNPNAMLAAAQRRFAESQAHLPPERQAELRDPQAMAQAEAALQQAIQQALDHAQADQMTPQQAEARRAQMSLVARIGELRAEIAAARKGGIAAATIQQAEAALGQAEKTQDSNRALAIVKQARDALQVAWAGVTETEKIRTRNADAARVVVVRAQAQLAVAQSLLQRQQQAGWDASRERLLGELNMVATTLETADSRLRTDPHRALEEATQAETQLNTLMGSVYQSGIPAVGGAASAAALGRLDALSKMLTDAQQVAALVNDRATMDSLMSRVQMLTQAANQATEASLAPLTEETERLKQDVFTFINSHQQKATADAIAETLASMRFHSRPGSADAPEVREIVPGLYQVVGVREDAANGGGRDDKRVLFTLSDDGKVTYDFSGYVGDACLADAQAIFKALRDKNIVIADADWVRRQNLSSMSDSQLMAAPAPTFDVNKRQTELIARVVRALAQMGFQPDTTEITVANGVVQIDARSGALGYYHVAIEPDGDMRTAKNNQNVTSDTSDAIAHIASMADLPAGINAVADAEDTDEDESYIQSRGSLQQ